LKSKCIIVLVLFMLVPINTWADMIRFPYYESRDTYSIQIDSIERTPSATIIYGRYRNFYNGESWCNIDSNTKLIDCNTGKTYRIFRAEGIFMSPSRLRLKPNSSDVDFKFYFEPIPHSTMYVDMIEFEDEPSFCFYQIDLTGKKRDRSEPDFISNDNIGMPQFPGGPEGLFRYLQRSIIYPYEAEREGIQGRVICSFVVDSDGSIVNVKVVWPVHYLLDYEAVRVISGMPRWIPGNVNGKSIRVKYTVPVTFRI